jgi:PelA/Pel-15E family pectate lyase
MKAHGLAKAIEPPKSASPKGTPLDRTATWYAGDEARRIAENVASFQTPAGGWSKHTDFAKHQRAPGELFAGDSNSKFIIAGDFDQPADVNWNYVGTFDNNATITELHFLAKVISASNTDTVALKKSFRRGLEYVFAAQFPNGGWPQVWPLQGGYHDAVTFNDDAMLNILRLLRDVSSGQKEFSFVPAEVRAAAEKSFQHGLDCVLATQVVVAGRRTVWPQQCDALTLKPCSARNYEMPSLASSESATLILFFMEFSKPSSEVAVAVQSATAWFEKTKINGKEFKSLGKEGRTLHDAPGAGPIWPRYSEIGTDRPLFGDRDLSIHDDVNEISKERRKGYGWFKDSAKRVAQHYAKWARQHPNK